MLDSTTTTAWEYKVIADIQASEFAAVSLVVLNDTLHIPLTRWQRLRLVWPSLFYSLYLKWDYRHSRKRVKHDAFKLCDLTEQIKDVPLLRVKPEQKRFTDRFAQTDIDAIQAADLDVMIRFGFRIIRGDILSAMRYGVWSMHHGDNHEYRGGPAHFWEIYENNPLTGVVLQVLSEKLDDGLVIYRSWGRTNPHSLFLNRNAAYWKSAEFYGRRLRQLHERGWDFIKGLDDSRTAPAYTKGIYRNPGNLTMLRFLWRVSSRWMRGWVKRQWTREAWFIAWRRRDGNEIGIGTGELQMLEAPSDRYYADPFLVDHQGDNCLFFEDFPYSTGKGVISYFQLGDRSPSGQVQRVLDRPYHLSFPFMLYRGNDLVMIPETRGNGCIERFKCVSFPGDWVPDGTVMPGVSAADSVLFHHEGTWWLFTNVAVPGAAGDDELSLFYSDSDSGPWIAHPLNPVVSDVRGARMAGNVFIMGEALVRPAQNGSRGYGAGVVFHRIEKLTRHDYKETAFHHISDAGIPGNIGTHTYNRNEMYEVIDGRFLKPKWK